jgi:polyisoprenoid-binding protein YceI
MTPAIGAFLLGCSGEIDNKPAATVEPPAPTVTASVPAPAAEVLAADATKSRIDFVGAKVTREHQGGFRQFTGEATLQDGVPTGASFTIELDSVWTDSEKLTGHLTSADFFDVALHPRATFQTTALEALPEALPGAPTHRATGNLDLHGVARSVSFPIRIDVAPTLATAAAEFTINRHDWDVSYPGKPDDLIKDEVLLKLDLAFPRGGRAAVAVDGGAGGP